MGGLLTLPSFLHHFPEIDVVNPPEGRCVHVFYQQLETQSYTNFSQLSFLTTRGFVWLMSSPH